mmetsp:Transcript_16987/g.54890  ORF Transcript_16987/g.54890 Transcript_16987/m.54890 type:complete len:217 (+) Transcript_16987:344-994(+)
MLPRLSPSGPEPRPRWYTVSSAPAAPSSDASSAAVVRLTVREVVDGACSPSVSETPSCACRRDARRRSWPLGRRGSRWGNLRLCCSSPMARAWRPSSRCWSCWPRADLSGALRPCSCGWDAGAEPTPCRTAAVLRPSRARACCRRCASRSPGHPPASASWCRTSFGATRTSWGGCSSQARAAARRSCWSAGRPPWAPASGRSSPRSPRHAAAASRL